MAKKKQRLSYDVPIHIHEWYKHEAERKGMTMASLFNHVMEQYIDMQEGMRVMKDVDQVKKLMESLENIKVALDKEYGGK